MSTTKTENARKEAAAVVAEIAKAVVKLTQTEDEE